MKTLCEKAKVPYFRFHPIRHAGASLMDAVNTPITSIQTILGHESRKTTEIYLHSNIEDHALIMDVYEKARMDSTKK